MHLIQITQGHAGGSKEIAAMVADGMVQLFKNNALDYHDKGKKKAAKDELLKKFMASDVGLREPGDAAGAAARNDEEKDNY